MSHPEYRKVGELNRHWIKLVASKALLFMGSFAALLLLGHLQERGQIGVVGSCGLVALAVSGLVALFTWDFWPSRRCPDCHANMQRCQVRPSRPSPPSEKAMVLCCHRCKTYVDLNVSTD